MERSCLTDIQLKTIELKISAIEKLLSGDGNDFPEWISLEYAVNKKGGAKLTTVRAKYYLQPCCGLNYKYIGGCRCWRKSDVIEWMQVDDSALPEYAAKWGVKLPSKKVA